MLRKKVRLILLFVILFLAIFQVKSFASNVKTKDDGIYKMAVGINPKKTIEVSESSLLNNASIDIWDYRK